MTEEDTFKTLSRIPYNQLIEKLEGWHDITVNDTWQRLLDGVCNKKEIEKANLLNRLKIFGYVEPILINLSFSRETKLSSLEMNIRFNGTGWEPEDYLRKVEEECAKDLVTAEKIKRNRKTITRSVFLSCFILGGISGYFMGAFNFFLFLVPFLITVLGAMANVFLLHWYSLYTKDTTDFEKYI